MDLISTFKNNLVLFGTVAAGVYFVTPMIQPSINSLPLVGSLSFGSQAAILAGVYGVVGVNLNSKYQI